MGNLENRVEKLETAQPSGGYRIVHMATPTGEPIEGAEAEVQRLLAEGFNVISVERLSSEEWRRLGKPETVGVS